MDDLWWAFIAGIDKQALLRELPGSVDDRRMREQHAAHVARIRAAANTPPPVDDGLALERRLELVAASRGWRAAEERNRTPTERQIAAYAARKRGHAA